MQTPPTQITPSITHTDPRFKYTSLPLSSSLQVPASYVALQRLIAEEVRVCQVKGIPPVLNQKEFAALSDFIPDSDISDPEELSLGEWGHVRARRSYGGSYNY